MCNQCRTGPIATASPSRSICARELMAASRTMGIPHFQRGQVWPESATEQLLESLFEETPCGTIILWEAEKPWEEGVPLEDPGFSKLLIDGQQRVRALRAAFGLTDQDSIWYLDLAVAAHRLGATAPRESGKHQRRLFLRKMANGANREHALLALDALLPAQEESGIRDLVTQALAQESLELSVRVEQALHGAILRMVSGAQFHERVLHQGRSMREVVGIYNRINSAGVRVEAEERAYATLVSLAPKATSEALRAALPGPTGGQSPGALSARDRELQRSRETQFGFKLFMRTAVQSCLYHANLTVGSTGLEFGKVGSPTIQDAASRNQAGFERTLHDAAVAMQQCRAILQEELHCDDLRYLPDTWTLQPVLQLLITFPELSENKAWRASLAALALRFVLAPPERTRHQVDAIRAACEGADAQAAIASTLSAMYPNPTKGFVRDELSRRVEQSKNQHSRIAKLLYWLLRKNSARDFTYRNLKHSRIEHNGVAVPAGEELLVGAENIPSFQHIVPFSSLLKHGDRRTTGDHAANALGNATYISWPLNEFQKGLGASPMSISLEAEWAPNNLTAHFLRPDDSIEVATYDTFCSKRSEAIKQGFMAWLAATEEYLLPDHTAAFAAFARTKRICA